jgi:hypothetical protein
MNVTMKRLMCSLLGVVALSLSSVASHADGCTCPEGKTNAGLGNGSERGDPGNSGAHNQAANAPAQPQSAAAQADEQHEMDDADEPN